MIYRYESIKKGQIFEGIIVVEGNDKEINEAVDILSSNEFYFGGSKGSGYGRCAIKNIKILKDNPENEFYKNYYYKGNNKNFYIYMLSDIISRDEYGRIISYIDESVLQNKLGLKKVSLEESSIETAFVSGYNSKWKCHVPQINTIKAGSIFKYSYEGELSEEKIKNLINEGIGDRRNEGFGRILILNDILFNKVSKIKGAYYKEKIKEPCNFNYEEKEQIQDILTKIYENIIINSFDEMILSWDSKFINKLNNSQIGKLIEILGEIKFFDSKKGKEIIKRYFEHMSNKKNNLSAYNSFKISQFKSKSFIDFLMEFIEKCDNVEVFNKNFEKCVKKELVISSIKPKIDKEYVYKLNIKFLEEFFRFQQRKEGETIWA